MVEIQANPGIGDSGIISIRVPGARGLHPFVVGIHGGGWQNGDRRSYDWCWARLQSLRVGLVLCSHRSARQARFPAAYDDLLHLLRWLHAYGAEHRLDTERCALFGCSSGGHLVSLLGTRATREDGRIPSIRGLVSYAGIMDVSSWFLESSDSGPQNTTVTDFMGATPDEDPEAYREASPIYHVHNRVPPMLLIHGAADAIVPVSQSQRMRSALKNAGHQPVLIELEGDGHFAMNASSVGEEKEFICEEQLLEFFQIHLGCGRR